MSHIWHSSWQRNHKEHVCSAEVVATASWYLRCLDLGNAAAGSSLHVLISSTCQHNTWLSGGEVPWRIARHVFDGESGAIVQTFLFHWFDGDSIHIFGYFNREFSGVIVTRVFLIVSAEYQCSVPIGYGIYIAQIIITVFSITGRDDGYTVVTVLVFGNLEEQFRTIVAEEFVGAVSRIFGRVEQIPRAGERSIPFVVWESGSNQAVLVFVLWV